MSDTGIPEEQQAPDASGANTPRRWAKRIGWTLAAVVALMLALFAILQSPIGKRIIVDQIASYAPASGLRFEVGRIEGDVFRDARLRDVEVSDPEGVFLRIPLIEIDWRPLSWIASGLDVRKLVIRDGELARLPEMLPGEPDAPILPDFDIRIDRFEIDNLTLLPGVATDRPETVNLFASANIRRGLVSLTLDGKLGDADQIVASMLAEPDGDRFEVDVDYRAPEQGVIAGLVGATSGYEARLIGDGTWQNWLGNGLIWRGDERFAAFQVTNSAGRYRMLGEAYASQVAEGILRRALGQRTGFIIDGSLESSRFDGSLFANGAGLRLRGSGVVDLSENRFEDFNLLADVRDPQLLSDAVVARGASLAADFEGPFRELSIAHELKVAELEIGDIRVSSLKQVSTASLSDGALSVPLNLAIGQILTGSELADAQLSNGRINGQLVYSNGKIRSDTVRVAFPRLRGQLSLEASPASGRLAVAGPLNLSGLPLDGVGTAQARADIDFALNGSSPWSLSADIDGSLDQLESGFLRQIAGDTISVATNLSSTGGTSVAFEGIAANSDRIELTGSGEWIDSRFSFAAQGTHASYGEFALDASVEDGSPSLVALLRSPLPSAGLRDVRLALAPIDTGYGIDAEGMSTLGPFAGSFILDPSTERAPASLNINRLTVWETALDGRLLLEETGLRGSLAIAGGGLDGTVDMVPGKDGQQISANIISRNAVFGGDTAVELGQAEIDLSGTFGDGSSRLRGEINGRGIRYGRLFLGRVAARANIVDGKGDIAASIIGRHGGRFRLELDGQMVPGRLAAAVRGEYVNTPISMRKRAIFTRLQEGGWQLMPAHLEIGDGGALISGSFGGQVTLLDLKLADIPLSLADLAVRDLGASGAVSGIVQFRQNAGEAPIGSAKLKVDGLSRSGLLLASPAIDVSLVATLGPADFSAKALVLDQGERIGWMDAQINGMPSDGILYERMQRGALSARMQYDGAAERLWRLAAIDALDISGPVSLQAEADVTLANPRVRGSLMSEKLRVRSVLSGTDIRDLIVRGRFEGPRLKLSSFSGRVGEDGKIEGSGFVDLSDIGPRQGPSLDLRASAKSARLVDARGLRATISGPLRIVSSGVGGTIAGRVEVENASWRLGTAADDVSLPEIPTSEVNLPADIAPPARAGAPWRYLVNARARNRVDVDGMGLDSEWRGDLVIRGTTSDPRLGGEMQVVRGTYSFADTSFELTRGRITFDESVPIDPRIDILAEASREGLDVEVSVRGNALTPEIAFSSEPPFPEEEILARLLFGGPITELSPIDALQLGAALASLRGGGGLDPVNRLRSEIGLDRLRVVAADPVLGRGTGVLLGENIGRRFYVELITDGKGYSATELEFRITSWLSLLGSVSTLGRESVVLEASRDY